VTGGEGHPQVVAQQVIWRALCHAVGTTGLRIRRPPGLAGAYLSGQRVHVYVIARGGTYRVELWKLNGQDPCRTTVYADLDTAVAAAVAAAVAR
jgi:hypothetical protein